MTDQTSTCFGCYWYEACGSPTPCDDFTPMDNRQDIAYYHNTQQENAAEYQRWIAEMNDKRGANPS